MIISTEIKYNPMYVLGKKNYMNQSWLSKQNDEYDFLFPNFLYCSDS